MKKILLAAAFTLAGPANCRPAETALNELRAAPTPSALQISASDPDIPALPAEPANTGAAKNRAAAGQTNPVTAVEFYSSFNKDGFSDKLAIEVPPGAKSMQIEIYSDAAGVPLVTDLFRTGADGAVRETLISYTVEKGFDPDQLRNIKSFSGEPGPFLSPNRTIYCLHGYGSAVVPNNPGVVLTPGAWKVRVKDVSGNLTTPKFKLRALFRVPDKTARKRVLPLNLYFSGAAGWTQEAYRSKRADLTDFLGALTGIFAAAGIDLQIAAVTDLGGASQNPGGLEVNTFEQVESLLNTGSATNGINLFFLRTVLGGLGGFASGIGGPALSPGYTFGGIALSEPNTRYPRIFANTVAHELGHYLGLYHDRELGTLISDQIPDTTPDRKLVNIMSSREPNDPGQIREFTPQQIEVISRHPAVIEIP
ncbi:MAG: zinc-dependent metalloprotease family protein [Elusimicrobiales bacterium]|jgi:hypothetical protein